MGPGVNHDKSIRLLNRVITWGEDGIEYEADQRHAEIIIRDLGLEENSKSLSTPGGIGGSSDDPKLEGESFTMYRAIVARAMYLAQDRGDIAHPAQELARFTSSPSNQDWENLNRLGST